MHLIHDENGNPCAHSHNACAEGCGGCGHLNEHGHPHGEEHPHEHEHPHGEEHPHEHPHPHGEEHPHEHPHPHGHEHPHGEPQGDKLTALLDYMLKHNEHHAAELDQVAAKLRAEGKEAAAEQIKKAVDEFQKGNLYLGLALSMVKEAEV